MRIKGRAVNLGNRTTAHVQLVTPEFSAEVRNPISFTTSQREYCKYLSYDIYGFPIGFEKVCLIDYMPYLFNYVERIKHYIEKCMEINVLAV